MAYGTCRLSARWAILGYSPPGQACIPFLHDTRIIVTADTQRRRAMGQVLLLAAAFLVLVAISAASVVLVTESRKDNAWVVHSVEVANQLSTLLLQIRRAESAARGYLLTSEPRFL